VEMSPTTKSFLKIASSIKILGAELEDRAIFARLSIWLVRNGFFRIRIICFLFQIFAEEQVSKNGRVLSYD
jgi:hypothetical protein